MWESFHLSKIARKEWLQFRGTKCELLINIGSLSANYIKAFVEWLLRLCELHEIYEGMSPTVQRTALRDNLGLILVSDGKMLGRAKSMLLAIFLWASWDLSYLLATFSSYRAVFRVRISWWLGARFHEVFRGVLISETELSAKHRDARKLPVYHS